MFFQTVKILSKLRQHVSHSQLLDPCLAARHVHEEGFGQEALGVRQL
jgi:hypothetical protein